MAVPKCKVSKARRDKRRGSNWKLAAPGVVACPKCGEFCLALLARERPWLPPGEAKALLRQYKK